MWCGVVCNVNVRGLDWCGMVCNVNVRGLDWCGVVWCGV